MHMHMHKWLLIGMGARTARKNQLFQSYSAFLLDLAERALCSLASSRCVFCFALLGGEGGTTPEKSAKRYFLYFLFHVSSRNDITSEEDHFLKPEEQEREPGGDVLPAAHLTHAAEPSVEAYCAAGHARHAAGSDAPFKALALPRGQGVHATMPVAAWYLPAPHSTQCHDAFSSWYCPIAHEEHNELPVLDANLPAAQKKHSLPAPGEYLPTAQLVQLAAAPREYLPATQLAQLAKSAAW
jgi:hypothetical protein